MKSKKIVWFLILGVALALLLAITGTARARQMAQPASQGIAPQVVSYQGQVMVGGLPYNGQGYFKFAILNQAGDTTYWTNDGTASGEPANAVALTITGGLFNVLLGDTSLANMNALPASVFSGSDRTLRVWFSTDGSIFTWLSPDRRFAAVPYALQAEEAGYAIEAGTATSAGDADTLDGQQASAFAASSHNHDAAYVNEAQANSISTTMIIPGTLLFSDLGQNGCTSGQSPQWNGSAWVCAGVTVVTAHGDLTGLAGDDHPQYFNLGQSETVTGIPAFNGGTTGASAPFSVDSANLVLSLNADLLDGQQASAFASSSHNHDAAYVNEGQADSISTTMIIPGTLLFSDLGQNGCTSGQSPQWNGSAWVCVASLTDHGGLNGLADDDHPQYFSLAQSETVTGIPAFNGGTTGASAPFSVDSTNLVLSLNADLLDGQQARAFAVSSHNPDASYVHENQADSISTTMVINGTLLFNDLGQNGCAAGQSPQWDGSAWVCASVASASDVWKLGGNAGTDPANNYLGTSDAVTLTLGTNGAGQAFLTPAGRLGLGDSRPGERLSIAGNAVILGQGAPVALGFVNPISSAGPHDIVVVGHYAYATFANSSHLAVFDISNPRSPVLVGVTNSGLWGPRGLAVAGRYAYVTSINNNRLVIFDISDPKNITNVGSTYTNLGWPLDIAIAGRYAYVLNESNNRLAVFDISSPIPVARGFTSINDSYPRAIAVDGRYAYVTSISNNRLAVFDISDPDNPVALGYTSTNLSEPEDVFVSGRYAYVTSYGNHRLAVFDVSDPNNLVALGYTSTTLDGPAKVVVTGRYAFVTSYTGLSVFDVSDPSNLVASGFTATNLFYPGGIAVDGRYAYVLSYWNYGLSVFDLNHLDAPTIETGSLKTGNLRVGESATLGGSLTVQGGLDVGPSGALINGDTAIQGSLTVNGDLSANILTGTLALSDLGQNGCTSGQSPQWNSSAWACASVVNQDQASSISTGMVINGTLLFTDLGQNGCTLGQSPKWDGSAWVCGTPVTDHGALNGLADDDHPQYFNLGQNETVTGIPAFNGGVSGTSAPFSVDSTTLVTNLNADLLDGQQTSYYANSTHNHDGTYVNEGQVDSVTSAMITNGTVALADLGQNGCTTDQIIKWNGSAWICTSDNAPSVTFVSVSGDTTLTSSQAGAVVLVNADTANITLPSAATCNGCTFTIKKLGNNTFPNGVDVLSAGGNIDGAASDRLYNKFAWVTVVSNGSHWWIISHSG